MKKLASIVKIAVISGGFIFIICVYAFLWNQPKPSSNKKRIFPERKKKISHTLHKKIKSQKKITVKTSNKKNKNQSASAKMKNLSNANDEWFSQINDFYENILHTDQISQRLLDELKHQKEILHQRAVCLIANQILLHEEKKKFLKQLDNIPDSTKFYISEVLNDVQKKENIVPVLLNNWNILKSPLLKKSVIQIFGVYEKESTAALPILISALNEPSLRKDAEISILNIIKYQKTQAKIPYITFDSIYFLTQNTKNKNILRRKSCILLLSKLQLYSKMNVHLFIEALSDENRFIQMISRKALKQIDTNLIIELQQQYTYPPRVALFLSKVCSEQPIRKKIIDSIEMKPIDKKYSFAIKKNYRILFFHMIKKSLYGEEFALQHRKDDFAKFIVSEGLDKYSTHFSLEVIVQIFNEKNEFLAHHASKILRIIGRETVPILHRSLKSQSASKRALSAQTLGDIFPKTRKTIVKLLHVMNTDISGWVRIQAALALEK